MKISTQKLKSALASICRIVKTRTTLPILSTVRMHAAGGILEVKVSSIDQLMIARVPCEGELAAMCVGIHALNRQQFNSEWMDIATDGGGAVKIKCGTMSVSLNTLPEDEFPADPKPDGMVQVGVPVDGLSVLLSKSAWGCFCADNSRYNLESVLVEGKGKSLTCSSTNGHIGVRAESLLICADFKTSVHKDFASLASECLSMDSSGLHVSSNWIKIAWPMGEYWCRVPDSNFPIAGFEQVYSLITQKIGSVSVEETKRAMRSCLSIKPPERNCGVLLSFSKTSFSVHFQGTGSDCSETEMEGSFVPWNQKIEAQYVLDSLVKMDGPACDVFKANNNSGLAFRQGDYTALIVGIGIGSVTP